MFTVLEEGTAERIKRDGIRIAIPAFPVPVRWPDNPDPHHEIWQWLYDRMPRPYWLVFWEKDSQGKDVKVYQIAPEYSDIAMLFKLTWGGK